jgi:hypothetical protein
LKVLRIISGEIKFVLLFSMHAKETIGISPTCYRNAKLEPGNLRNRPLKDALVGLIKGWNHAEVWGKQLLRAWQALTAERPEVVIGAEINCFQSSASIMQSTPADQTFSEN